MPSLPACIAWLYGTGCGGAYPTAIAAGRLGLDCRYCHSTVEKTAFAAIPPAQICMNCHSVIRHASDKDPGHLNHRLRPVFDSFASGKPVNWVKIHDLPDYVFFNHSAHVNHG